MPDKSTFGARPEGIDRLFAIGLDESNSDRDASAKNYMNQLLELFFIRIRI